MIELEGKHGKAKVFTSTVDETTVSQIFGLLNSPISEDARLRIMPDCHAGAGCVIGTTMKIRDKICPNLVGVDIGCGVFVVRLGILDFDLDYEDIDNFIKENIPHGFSTHERGIFVDYEEKVERYFGDLRCYDALYKKERLVRSSGTLGGGNHFIEIAEGTFGSKYLLVHTGSRNLGFQVAKYYQKKATEQTRDSINEEREKLIAKFKESGKTEEIQPRLQKFNRENKISWGTDLDYLTGDLKDDYLHDMKIVQHFAAMNREKITKRIINKIFGKGEKSLEDFYTFDTVHNYIDVESGILRKGAVSARKGEMLVIPINMREGSLICEGKGSLDWNYSAPHGAGRILSRSEAKETLSVEEFKNSMELEGIYTSTANEGTLDEAPGAYKSLEDILDNVSDTVEIIDRVRPVYNFKA